VRASSWNNGDDPEPTKNGPVNLSGSVEVHAHAILGTPSDGAGQMQAIAWDNQGEFRRDTDRAGYLQQGSGGRQVANSAIDGDAAKLDGCGFQDAVTNCDPSFDHPVEIRQKLKESIKNPSAIS
jgi:hypothetical protein